MRPCGVLMAFYQIQLHYVLLNIKFVRPEKQSFNSSICSCNMILITITLYVSKNQPRIKIFKYFGLNSIELISLCRTIIVHINNTANTYLIILYILNPLICLKPLVSTTRKRQMRFYFREFTKRSRGYMINTNQYE